MTCQTANGWFKIKSMILSLSEWYKLSYNWAQVDIYEDEKDKSLLLTSFTFIEVFALSYD